MVALTRISRPLVKRFQRQQLQHSEASNTPLIYCTPQLDSITCAGSSSSVALLCSAPYRVACGKCSSGMHERAYLHCRLVLHTLLTVALGSSASALGAFAPFDANSVIASDIDMHTDTRWACATAPSDSSLRDGQKKKGTQQSGACVRHAVWMRVRARTLPTAMASTNLNDARIS